MLRQKTNRFFVFDRDDTLIDKNNKLINPEAILRIIQEIDDSDDCMWAIASAGASSLEGDAGYKAITANIALRSEPQYVVYNRGKTLVKCITTVSDKSVDLENVDVSAFSKQQFAQLAFSILLYGEDFKFNQFVQIPDAPSGQKVQISDEAIFTLQLGNTLIKINASLLNKNLKLIADGDLKLFAVLMALDQAGLKVDVTDELKNMGIVEIAGHDDYQTILAADVIFIDDKKRNCALVQAAGFTTIDADTVCSKDHGKENVQNTYLVKLDNHLLLNKRFNKLDDYADFLKTDTRVHAFRVKNKAQILSNLFADLRSAKGLQDLKAKLDNFYTGKGTPGSDYEILNAGQGITTWLFNKKTTSIKKIDALRDKVDENICSLARGEIYEFVPSKLTGK